MGWFKKEKVIDMSHMKAKIAKPQDCVDLTQAQAQTPQTDSGLGFFGAIANNFDSSQAREVGDIHMQHLKVKIEDFEYKLDSFSKRISGLIDRVDLLEKKVDRDLRRGV